MIRAHELSVALVLAACSSSSSAPPADSIPGDDAGVSDTQPPDGDEQYIDKAAQCAKAATYGSELTAAFGRIDGYVLAVVKPTDTQCDANNSDHLVLQITMNGAPYRMVANVQSDTGDPRVQFLELDAPLVGDPWAEGWHTNIAFDYATTLGVHSTAFTPYAMDDLVNLVTNEITVGDKVSVFATSSGGSYSDSTHLIHRNLTDQDGAIVLGAATSKPHYLLFRFADQPAF